MSILERLYLGNLCPLEEDTLSDADYHSFSNKIGDEREYFAGILSEEDKKRFEEWNEMIFRCEDMTEYARFTQGFRLGAMLAFEIFSKNERE